MFFSVIVPIYNVEKYLKRCIESVLLQDFGDFELILVDDGSPDGSALICDKYQKKDSRIKVIHKQNGGLVSARQSGIKLAKGEYILNLDADDYITSDALESAYKIIKNTLADIVSFSYYSVKNYIPIEKKDDIIKEGLYNKEQMKACIYPFMLCDENMQHFMYFLSGRIIRADIIRPIQLSVNPKISHGEDVCCVIPCYLKAQRVYVSHKGVYFYTDRDGESLSTKFNPRQITNIADTTEHLFSFSEFAQPDFEAQISRYSAYMCFAIIALAAEGGHFKYIKQIKELINNSAHKKEIKKARFKNITKKSKISVFLMQKGFIGLTFYFLNLCKRVKNIKNFLIRKGHKK